jgi:hypothetical protein
MLWRMEALEELACILLSLHWFVWGYLGVHNPHNTVDDNLKSEICLSTDFF